MDRIIEKMTRTSESILIPPEFIEILEGTGFAIFRSIDGKGVSKCVSTNIEQYTLNKEYNYYQIPSLIRLIGRRLNLFTKDLQASLADKAEDIAVVIEWTEREKLFLIVEINQEIIQALNNYLTNEVRRTNLLIAMGLTSDDSKKENQRYLPRYEVWKLNCKVNFPIGDENQFRVKNISLSGIQIWTQSKLSLNHFHRVELKLGPKKPLALNLKQLWQTKIYPIEEGEGEFNFKSGYQLKFNSIENFQKWLAFTYAMEKLSLKNI